MLFENETQTQPVKLMVELLTLEETQADDPEIIKTVYVGIRNGLQGMDKTTFVNKYGYTPAEIREAYNNGITTLHLGNVNGTELVLWISEATDNWTKEVLTVDIRKTLNIILPSLDLVDEQENPQTVAHFTNLKGWDWYIIAGKPFGEDDFYLFGLVNGYEKELGFFTLKQIIDAGGIYDLEFIPIGVYDIYPDFDLRRHK